MLQQDLTEILINWSSILLSYLRILILIYQSKKHAPDLYVLLFAVFGPLQYLADLLVKRLELNWVTLKKELKAA